MPVPISDVKLHFVESVDDAQEFLRWLGQSREILAVDTETSGFHWYGPDTLRLVQFGDADAGWSISYRNWRGLIEKALRDYTGDVVMHNSSFDQHFLEAHGLSTVPVHRLHDTMIADTLIDPTRSHGLKPAAERIYPGVMGGQALLKDAFHRNKWNWSSVPENFPLYHQYAALDTVLTARLYSALMPQVQPYRVAYDREMAAMSVLFRAETRGMRIDPFYTSNLLAEWTQEAEGLLLELNNLGLENPNSGRQLAAAMALTEDWEPEAWTETGMPAVDASILKGIDSEISRRVLRYRRLTKWNGAYLSTFLNKRDANDHVHPTIRNIQARTGRMSITGPALQTLPRGSYIRDCVLPDEGQSMWAVDYDTMEMRMFAHYSQDPRLVQAVHEGQDLHLFAAREIYGDPNMSKDDKRRSLAKNTGFGILFGAGDAKTAETAGVDVETAKAFRAAYKERYTGVDTFMSQIDEIGRKRRVETGRGYITTWGGRYSPADDKRLYALLNYLIQGSCADLFKDKIIALDSAGYGDNIILPVHDELLFNFPEGDTESIQDVVSLMEERERFSVPFTVGVSGPLTRWGDKARKEES